MNDLVEVRGTNHDFELRNGVRVEYAAGDREARMRALGCPEEILQRVRARKGSAKRSTVPAAPAPRFNRPELLAAANGMTVAQMNARSNEARLSVARAQGKRIATQSDADRRVTAARLGKLIAADAAQDKADDELRQRMEIAAGRVFSRRSKADAAPLEGEEGANGEFNALQSALQKSYPGHTLLGFSPSQKQAYSQHTSGTKFTVPYEQDAAGNYSFGKPALGGHPITLSDVS